MHKLALAAALLILVSNGALAQAPETPAQPAPEATQPKPPATPEPTQPAPPAPESAQPSPSESKAAEMTTVVPGDSATVTDYYKQNVYDASDNTIGEVSDVLVDKDGQVTAVILSVGGFLGLGAKYVSVPFKALQLKEKDGKRYLVIETSKESLASAPGYQYDKATGKWVPEAK